MSKLLCFPVFMLAVILAASPAWARVWDFGVYTIDIPAGWSVAEDGNLVTVVSPDRQAVLLITTNLSQQHHYERVAPEEAKFANLIRVNPKKKVTVTRLRWERVIVTIIGDHRDRAKVYRSIKAVKEK